MKSILYIEPISEFTYYSNFKVRTEVEHYSDNTTAIVIAQYILRTSL